MLSGEGWLRQHGGIPRRAETADTTIEYQEAVEDAFDDAFPTNTPKVEGVKRGARFRVGKRIRNLPN